MILFFNKYIWDALQFYAIMKNYQTNNNRKNL